MPQASHPSASRTRAVVISFVLAANLSCGAEGSPAPEPLDDTAAPSSCPSPRTLMPGLFGLVDDGSNPLGGLRRAMARASSGAAAGDNAIGGLVSNLVGGLRAFASDPSEVGEDGCLATEPMSGDEPLAFCRVEATSGSVCQSRFCATKRGMKATLREGGGDALTRGLSPILVKLFGYWSNHGRGADGVSEHLRTFDVLQRTARRENAAVCAPDDLLGLVDGLVLFARPVPGCGDDCEDVALRSVLRRIAADPQLQTFSDLYESETVADESGRKGFAKLTGLLLEGLARAGPDDDVFATVERLLDQVRDFIDPVRKPEYGPLYDALGDLKPLLRKLLDAPASGLPLRRRLIGVARCFVTVDPTSDLASELFGAFSRPGGGGGDGLDLIEVVDLLDDLAEADPMGLMASMAHAVLASTTASEVSVEGVRLFMRAFLGAENGRDALPSLQRMFESDVLGELLVLLDHIVHGCPAPESTL